MFIATLIALGVFSAGVMFGKRRRRFGYGGCGHGHGHHHRGGFDDDDGHDWGHKHSRRGFSGFKGFGPGKFWMGRVLNHLETTPSQRRAIEEAMGGLQEELRGMRDSVFGSRRDLADALRGEELDVDALGATLAGGDEAVDRVRNAIAGFVGKLHTVLDEEQRQRLAELLERRFGRGHGWA